MPSEQKYKSGNGDQSGDFFAQLIDASFKNTRARNNYYRAAAFLGLGALFFFFVFPITLMCIAMSFFCLCRGIVRDAKSKALFLRSPTARELHLISQRPQWAERRRQLLAFPCTLSDRDERIVLEGQSMAVSDPFHAMGVLGATLERKALATFGDSVHCFQLKRFYDNYPPGQLYFLSQDLQNNNVPPSTSGQSFCFCQRKKENFFPYLMLVYIHIVVEGQWIRSRVYVHGFGLSTWFGEEDERLKLATLPNDVVQLWNEGLAQYIQNNQSGARPGGNYGGEQKTQQGRTSR